MGLRGVKAFNLHFQEISILTTVCFRLLGGDEALSISIFRRFQFLPTFTVPEIG